MPEVYYEELDEILGGMDNRAMVFTIYGRIRLVNPVTGRGTRTPFEVSIVFDRDRLSSYTIGNRIRLLWETIVIRKRIPRRCLKEFSPTFRFRQLFDLKTGGRLRGVWVKHNGAIGVGSQKRYRRRKRSLIR